MEKYHLELGRMFKNLPKKRFFCLKGCKKLLFTAFFNQQPKQERADNTVTPEALDLNAT